MATAATVADDPSKASRWYRPAPGRVPVGLLIVVGLLWFSERFQWFALNERKGWTVLLAVALVAATLAVLLLWFAVSLLLRWRFQFSLRSLLALVVAVAVPCSWLAVELRRAERQRVAVNTLRAAENRVKYNFEFREYPYPARSAEALAPALLRRILSDDFFATVLEVRCYGDLDAELDCLRDLTALRSLSVGQFCNADAALQCIAGMKQLEALDLNYTRINDVGLDCLKRMNALQLLSLEGTDLSGGRTGFFAGLTRLWALHLGRTQVGDADLAHLEGLTQLKVLNLDHTHVTDRGLDHLKGLTALQRLNLVGTQVTAAGAEEFRRALPECEIVRDDGHWRPGLRSLTE